MAKKIEVFEELFNACKTVMLPRELNSDCYAVFSGDEFSDKSDKRLSVDGKSYKHRLFFFKRLDGKNKKTLSIIILEPDYSSHKKQSALTKKCEKIAKDNGYGCFEIYAVFTLRTTDKIDALLENSILDITRINFNNNDILLAYGDNLKKTVKHKTLPTEELRKINKVKKIKTDNLLKFLTNLDNNIYTIGLTKSNNPKTPSQYNGQKMVKWTL